MSDLSYRLTDHAKEEMARRGITLALVAEVMAAPGQIVPNYGNRVAYQSQIEMDDKLYVVRVIVEPGDPDVIVTVYRSSKIEKYWRDDDESDL